MYVFYDVQNICLRMLHPKGNHHRREPQQILLRRMQFSLAIPSLWILGKGKQRFNLMVITQTPVHRLRWSIFLLQMMTTNLVLKTGTLTSEKKTKQKIEKEWDSPLQHSRCSTRFNKVFIAFNFIIFCYLIDKFYNFYSNRTSKIVLPNGCAAFKKEESLEQSKRFCFKYIQNAKNLFWFLKVVEKEIQKKPDVGQLFRPNSFTEILSSLVENELPQVGRCDRKVIFMTNIIHYYWIITITTLWTSCAVGLSVKQRRKDEKRVKQKAMQARRRNLKIFI